MTLKPSLNDYKEINIELKQFHDNLVRLGDKIANTFGRKYAFYVSKMVWLSDQVREGLEEKQNKNISRWSGVRHEHL